MRCRRSVFLAVVVFLGSESVLADPLPALPIAAMPAAQCIHRVLKSSSAVRSVDLYSIDGDRFAVEYVFRNKDNQAVVSDIEFFELNGSVIQGDKIPREVSMETASEAQDLESKLDLVSKCHLHPAFDNLLPPPKARIDWQEIGWPND